jgi:hypothetical protein
LREPPALPETEIAVVRLLGTSSHELEQGPPLVNLVRRCIRISDRVLDLEQVDLRKTRHAISSAGQRVGTAWRTLAVEICRREADVRKVAIAITSGERRRMSKDVMSRETWTRR